MVMETPAEIAAGVAVELFMAVAAIGLLYRLFGRAIPLPKRQEVLAFQRGVVLRSGRVERVAEPGSHWITPGRTLVMCDLRPKPFQVAGQELLTADGMGVRLSLGGEYKVVEPAAFLTQSTDSFGALYLEVRHALHVAVSEMAGDSVLREREVLVPRMKELLAPRAAQLGIEVTLLDVWEAVPMGWVRQI